MACGWMIPMQHMPDITKDTKRTHAVTKISDILEKIYGMHAFSIDIYCMRKV